MRRFMLMVSAAVMAAATLAGTVPASAAAGATSGAGCVSAGQATYRHTFDGGAGTATVTAVRGLCAGQSQVFGIASYTSTAGTGRFPQFVYAVTRATIDPAHRSVTLRVDVPNCSAQVGAIFGSSVLNELTGGNTVYGDAELGSPSGAGSRSAGAPAWYDGAGAACVTKPAVTFTSGCDGAFAARLSNGESATVDAVFVVGGRRIRLAPGRSATVTGRVRGSLSVRDSSFTTHVGSWIQPATGCTPPPTAPPSATGPDTGATGPDTKGTGSGVNGTGSGAKTTGPGTTTEATHPGANATSPAATAPTTEPAAVFPLVGAPAVAVPSPSNPTAALPATGSSLTSFVLISFGLLLVGGGLIFLGRSIQRARHEA